MSECSRYATRGHGNCHLMERLRKKSPEVPIRIGRSHSSTRITFDGMVKVGELERVTQKKYWCVVADKVPVTAVSKMILLGRLCGDALFLFAERSMPVPYIRDPDIKISDPHPGLTQRVLLDYRQAPCPTVWVRALPGKKNAGPPPQPDHTCFTRLPTTATLRQFGSGPCPGK